MIRLSSSGRVHPESNKPTGSNSVREAVTELHSPTEPDGDLGRIKYDSAIVLGTASKSPPDSYPAPPDGLPKGPHTHSVVNFSDQGPGPGAPRFLPNRELELPQLLHSEQYDEAAAVLHDTTHSVRERIDSDVRLVYCFAVLCDWWFSTQASLERAKDPACDLHDRFDVAMTALKPNSWAGKVLTAGLAASSMEQVAGDIGASFRSAGEVELLEQARNHLWLASRLALHPLVRSILHIDQSMALICKHLSHTYDVDLLDTTFLRKATATFPMLSAQLLAKLQLSEPILPPFEVHEALRSASVSTICPEAPLDKSVIQTACVSFPLWVQAKMVCILFNSGVRDGWERLNKIGASTAFRAKPAMLAMASALFAGFLPGVLVVGLLIVLLQCLTRALRWLFCMRGKGGAAAKDSMQNKIAQGLVVSGMDTGLRMGVVRAVPIRGLVKLPAAQLLGPLLEADVPVQIFGAPVMRALIAYQWHAFAKYLMFFQIMDHLLFMGVFITYSCLMANRWGTMMYSDKGVGGLQDYAMSPPPPPDAPAPPQAPLWPDGNMAPLAPPPPPDEFDGTACLNSAEKQCLYILTAMIILYAYQEGSQMWAFSKSWWNSLWDIELIFGRIQLISIALTSTIILTHWLYGCDTNAWTLRVLCCMETLLLFLRLVHFGRVFGKLGCFVRMIIQVLKDILIFLIVLGLVYSAFCIAFVVLQGPVTVASSNYLFLQQFTIIFNNFNYDFLYTISIASGPVYIGRAMILMKALYQIIVAIVMLNLLIAIINDSHEGVRMNESVEGQRSRAMLILQAEALLPDRWQRFMMRNLAFDTLCVIDVFEASDDSTTKGSRSTYSLPDATAHGAELDKWSGRMHEMKKSFKRKNQDLMYTVDTMQTKLEEQRTMIAEIMQILGVPPVIPGSQS